MNQDARAAVFEGTGLPIALRHFPLPHLETGECLVRVRLATLCGSDLHTYDGRRHAPCPSILGHEILGDIQELPPDGDLFDLTGQPLRVGDRVVWSMMASCGDCFYCRRDLPQKCEHLFKYGHEAITPSHALHGGLATHCHLRKGTALVRVPDAIPDTVACPMSCATATIAAALRYAGELRGATVLIQGAGMLGLTAAAMAQVRGASTIVLCDTRADRLQAGPRFGATHLFETNALREGIPPLTQGRGVDVALELSGAPAAAEIGLELLRIGGRAIWVGAVYPGDAVKLFAEKVVRKHLSIQGVHNYHPRDLLTACDFLNEQHQRFPFAELVSQPFALEAVETAFEHARQGTALRVAVKG